MTQASGGSGSAKSAQGHAARGQPGTQVVPPARRAGLDLATIVGLVAAGLLIGAALVLGGTPLAFLDLRAVLIVLLGTVAVTTISFPLSDLAAMPALMSRSLLRRRRPPGTVARAILGLAEQARRDGPLSLAMTAEQLRGEVFARHALNLVADSTGPTEIERVLTTEMESRMGVHARGAAILRRAGEVAPAMGLIGTLVGLVQLMGGLEDPATVGPAMAVALLTTLYGAILGQVVCQPLANKLELAADEEALLDHLYVLGATSMARQENPRQLETLLNAALPPGERVRYFD